MRKPWEELRLPTAQAADFADLEVRLVCMQFSCPSPLNALLTQGLQSPPSASSAADQSCMASTLGTPIPLPVGNAPVVHRTINSACGPWRPKNPAMCDCDIFCNPTRFLAHCAPLHPLRKRHTGVPVDNHLFAGHREAGRAPTPPEGSFVSQTARAHRAECRYSFSSNNFSTIRPKARIDFSLSVLNMLWWALGVNHRPT